MDNMAITAPKLSFGDTIGIICPSHVPDTVRHKRSIAVLSSLGFRVKLGENVYKDTYTYAASAQERAADLNAMVSNSDVKMVLFGGGEGAAEGVCHRGCFQRTSNTTYAAGFIRDKMNTCEAEGAIA